MDAETNFPAHAVAPPLARRVAARRPLLSRLLPYLLIAPTMLIVFLFTLWPTAQSVSASLYRPPRIATGEAQYVGLQNYADLFQPEHYLGSRFARVLGNTVLFALLTIAFSLPMSLLFALLLNRKFRGRNLARFGLFYPALLPFIGAASLWAFLFAETIGLTNTVLRTFGLGQPNWLGDPNLVLFSVTLVNIWKQASFYTIFYLAGLQSIPKDIFEAADIEGANWRQQLRFLTVPLLRRTTLFVLIVGFTMAFQTVEHLPALGQGGPGDSSNLTLYFIFQTIPERRNWGYVNAMTVIMLLIVGVFTVSNLLFFERRRDDEHD